MENHTAKHFVLQLGSLVSLYLSLAFLLVLLFGLINLAVPDAADGAWMTDSAATSVRIGIAMTIVFFPTYLILTRIVNQNRRQVDDGRYLGLTKWLIYLSLLVGGGVLLGDLVFVIMAFLEGDITVRFVLKAGSVLVVVGAAFSYYILDARSYWLTHEAQAKALALIASVLVAAALVGGFLYIDSPAEARERQIDEQQVRDLQDIQYQVSSYLNREGALPEVLDAVYFGSEEPPKSPGDRPRYAYAQTEDGFELCATFKTESNDRQGRYARPPQRPTDESAPVILNPDDWQHGTGEVCFERIVSFGTTGTSTPEQP